MRLVCLLLLCCAVAFTAATTAVTSSSGISATTAMATLSTTAPTLPEVSFPRLRLNKVGGGQENKSYTGEQFDYLLDVEFSPSEAVQASHFKLEVFSLAYMQSDQDMMTRDGPGPSSLHVWGEIVGMGSNIESAWSTHVHHKPSLSHIHDGLVFLGRNLHTNGLGPADNYLNISISTSTAHSPYITGWPDYTVPSPWTTQHVLFIAAELMDMDHVWVSMEEYILGHPAEPDVQHQFATAHSHQCSNSCNWGIMKRETLLVKLYLNSNLPTADYRINIAEAKGQVDTLYIGKPIIGWGCSFEGNNNIHLLPMPESSSGLLTQTGWDLTLVGVMNHGMLRDVNDTCNKIEISFVVTLLDNPGYFVNDIHQVSLSLNAKLPSFSTITTSSLLHKDYIISFIEVDQTSGVTQTPVLINTLDKQSVEQGGLAIASAVLEMDPGTNLMKVEIVCPGGTGLYPVNVGVAKNSLVGYIPPPWSVQTGVGTNDVTFDFGLVQIVRSAERITLEIEIETEYSTSLGDHSCTVEILGSGTQIFTVEVGAKNTATDTEDIQATLQHAWDEEFGVADQFAFLLDMTVPPGFGGESFELSFASKQSSGSLCSLTVETILPGTMCVDRDNTDANIHYGENGLGLYKVQGNISIARTCPRIDQNNRFRVQAVFEMSPLGLGETSEEMVALMMFQNSSFWHANQKINLSSTYSETSEKKYQVKTSGCVGGWKQLSVSKQFCYSDDKNRDKKIFCQKRRSILAEIHSGEEFDEFMLWMEELYRTGYAQTPVMLGGLVENGKIIWEKSGQVVPIYPYGFINPSKQDNYSSLLLTGSFLTFAVENPSASRFDKNPFRMVPKLVNGSRFPFVCMRENYNILDYSPLIHIYGSDNHAQADKPVLIKYLIKLADHVNTPFKFKVESSSNFRICKMEKINTGSNFPCHQNSQDFGWVGPFNTSRISYGSKVSGETGEFFRSVDENFAELSIDKLHNWGNGRYSSKKSVDKNSLLIGVYMITKVAASGEEYPSHSLTTFDLDGAEVLQEGNTTVRIKTGQKNDSGIGSDITVIPDDGSFQAEKGKCKRLRLVFSTQRFATEDLVAENLGFSSGYFVTWCGAFFTKVGRNFPCLNPRSKHWRFREQNLTTEFWSSIYLNNLELNSGLFSKKPEDNENEIEVSFRPDDEIPAGTDIQLKFSYCKSISGFCKAPIVSKTVTITVIDSLGIFTPTIPAYLKFWHQYYGQPSIYNVPDPVSLTIRQSHTSTIQLSFPHNTTLPTQLYVRSPVADYRALLNLRKISFNSMAHGACLNCLYGVLGTSNHLLIDRVYKVDYLNTDRTWTHMQTDAIYADFGYMTNPGYSALWGTHTDLDDHIKLGVTFELTDHPAAADGAEIKIETAFLIGDKIITTDNSSQIVVNRSETKEIRRDTFRANINILADVVDELLTLEEFSNFSVSSIISHDSSSRAEAYPAYARLIVDRYTGLDVSTVTTNYSVADVTVIIPDGVGDQGGFVDIVFPNGIMFTDVIELNFTVMLDPLKKISSEKNIHSTIMLTALCEVFPHRGYPTVNPTQCSQFRKINLIRERECEAKVDFVKVECQISASSVLDSSPDASPSNVINDTLAWKGPIREGNGWNNWVVFDFLTVRQITKVKVGFPATSRGPTSIRVDFGSSGSSFEKGDVIRIDEDKELKLSNPIHARFIKLVIVETNSVPASLKPVTMNQVEFYAVCSEQGDHQMFKQSNLGKPSRKMQAKYCALTGPVVADDVTNYRHFAVDTLNQVTIYFCDQSAFRSTFTSVQCYSSSDQGTTWLSLPNYVHHILGFSPVKGRMYLQDHSRQAFFSCGDGGRLDMVNNSTLPVMEGHDWQPALGVPGQDAQMASINWPGTSVEVTYAGISVGGARVVNWASCC